MTPHTVIRKISVFSFSTQLWTIYFLLPCLGLYSLKSLLARLLFLLLDFRTVLVLVTNTRTVMDIQPCAVSCIKHMGRGVLRSTEAQRSSNLRPPTPLLLSFPFPSALLSFLLPGAVRGAVPEAVADALLCSFL